MSVLCVRNSLVKSQWIIYRHRYHRYAIHRLHYWITWIMYIFTHTNHFRFTMIAILNESYLLSILCWCVLFYFVDLCVLFICCNYYSLLVTMIIYYYHNYCNYLIFSRYYIHCSSACFTQVGGRLIIIIFSEPRVFPWCTEGAMGRARGYSMLVKARARMTASVALTGVLIPAHCVYIPCNFNLLLFTCHVNPTHHHLHAMYITLDSSTSSNFSSLWLIVVIRSVQL